MAAFSKKCGNARFTIHKVDHEPAHCHVSGVKRFGKMKIDLYTFESIKPLNAEVPHHVMKCMRELQEKMLKAWDDVVIDPEAD